MTGESVMLFDQLPLGILAFLMGISCALKHTAIERLVHTRWYQLFLWKHYCKTAIVLVAVSSAAMIFLIFDKFVGVPKAIYLALIDFIVTIVTGSGARQVNVFEMETRQQRRLIFIIRSVFVLTYILFIWVTLG